MCLQLKVVSIWGVVGLQKHGFCSRRLVYIEVVQARSDYEKSYCGDLEIPLVVTGMGVTGLKKTRWIPP